MILNYRRHRKLGRVERVLRQGEQQWRIVGRNAGISHNIYSSENGCFVNMELPMITEKGELISLTESIIGLSN